MYYNMTWNRIHLIYRIKHKSHTHTKFSLSISLIKSDCLLPKRRGGCRCRQHQMIVDLILVFFSFILLLFVFKETLFFYIFLFRSNDGYEGLNHLCVHQKTQWFTQTHITKQQRAWKTKRQRARREWSETKRER